MKRTAHLIVASLFTGLLLAGCVAPGEPEEEEEDLNEPGVNPQSGYIITKTYYSEPAHINEIGECVTQKCWSPWGTTCTGSTSPYYTIVTEGCYGQ